MGARQAHPASSPPWRHLSGCEAPQRATAPRLKRPARASRPRPAAQETRAARFYRKKSWRAAGWQRRPSASSAAPAAPSAASSRSPSSNATAGPQSDLHPGPHRSLERPLSRREKLSRRPSRTLAISHASYLAPIPHLARSLRASVPRLSHSLVVTAPLHNPLACL